MDTGEWSELAFDIFRGVDPTKGTKRAYTTVDRAGYSAIERKGPPVGGPDRRKYYCVVRLALSAYMISRICISKCLSPTHRVCINGYLRMKLPNDTRSVCLRFVHYIINKATPRQNKTRYLIQLLALPFIPTIRFPIHPYVLEHPLTSSRAPPQAISRHCVRTAKNTQQLSS